MKRLTTFDKIRGVYIIEPDTTGNHIQRLGMYEDRDTPNMDTFTEVDDDGTEEYVFECGKCHYPVGSSYNFCPECGQRVRR